MKPAVLALLLLAAALPGDACARWLDPPPSPALAVVDSFVAEHPGEALLVLRSWSHWKVEPDGDYLRGEERSGYELLLSDGDAMKAAATVALVESPTVEPRGLRVQVWHADGTRDEYDRGDLEWVEFRERGNRRYVVLDGKVLLGAVPALRVGDRIRVEMHTRAKGLVGVPRRALGGLGAPTLQSSFALHPGDELDAELLLRGTDELASRARRGHEGGWLTARARGLEPVAPEPLGSGEPLGQLLVFCSLRAAEPGALAGNLAVAPGWREAGDRYLALMGERFHPDEAMRELAAQLGLLEGSPRERAAKAYAWVQQNCRYLGFYQAEHGFTPPLAREVAALGHGDCKGLGNLLLNLLRAAGVESHPVLLRTAWAGPLEEASVSLGQFNHFVVQARDETGEYLLDPTVPGCPLGQVPAADGRWPVLVLREGGSALEPVDPSLWQPGRTEYELRGALDPQARLDFELRARLDGEAAFDWRSWLVGAGEQGRASQLGKAALHRSLAPRIASLDILEGRGALDPRLDLRLAGESSRSLTRAGGEWYLPLALLEPPARPFADPERQQPLGLGTLPAHRSSLRLQLPAGVSLAAPDTLHVEREGLYWSRRSWQEGDSLFVEREVRWGPDPLPADQAPAFLADLDRALAAERGWVVLREAGP